MFCITVILDRKQEVTSSLESNWISVVLISPQMDKTEFYQLIMVRNPCSRMNGFGATLKEDFSGDI